MEYLNGEAIIGFFVAVGGITSTLGESQTLDGERTIKCLIQKL